MSAIATAPETATLPECISRTLAQIEETRVLVLSYAEDARRAEDLIARHVASLPSLAINSVGYGGASLSGVLIRVNAKSPKDVTALLRDARTTFGKMQSVEDYEAIQRRTYSFGRVKVLVFFDEEDSNACRFVKVGEKTEPVYQLLCPDGVAPESIDLSASVAS